MPKGRHVDEVEKDLMQVAEALKGLHGFDKNAFDQLIEDTGTLVVLRILARFEVGIKEGLRSIQEGIEQENCDPIWQACHKLTGSAELIGFKDFGAKSRRLNSDVKALPDVSTHLEDLKLFLKEGKDLSDKIATSFPQLKKYL